MSAIVKADEIQGSISEWYQTEGRKKLSMALSKPVEKVDKYWRGVMTTVSTDPYQRLSQCTPSSIVKSVMVSAQIGLAIDAREHAFLIPRKNHKQGTLEATFQPGYKGYIYQMRKCPKILTVTAEPVFRSESSDPNKFFVQKGTDPLIRHIPDLECEGRSEDITHFYAVVKFDSGETEFEVMTRAQVDEIMSRAATRDIWSKNYQQMGRKTVLLRLNTRLQLPETEELARIDIASHEGKESYVDEDGEIVITQKDEEFEHNEQADYEQSEEKTDLVQRISEAGSIIGKNKAQMLADLKRVCFVNAPHEAKIDNLEKMYAEYDAEVTEIQNAKA
jgi:recombination protein RecT